MQSLLGDHKNFEAACPRWIHEAVAIRLIYFCYLIVFQEEKKKLPGILPSRRGWRAVQGESGGKSRR